MNALFFGTGERSLYGVYHPPRARVARRTGVVLCYPFGQEYMRSHRAFRQLASLLTRAGFHLFRFDYYATGDSSGHSEEVTLAQWFEDIGTAIEELRETADVEQVALVGLRLGATLAAQVAAVRDDVSHVVLWDPIVSGASYLRDLLASSDETMAGQAIDEADTVGVNGFPLSPSFRRELSAIDLTERGMRLPGRSLMVVSGSSVDFTRAGDALVASGSRLERREVPSPGNWGEVDDNGSALIPVALIQAIVQDLTTECV